MTDEMLMPSEAPRYISRTPSHSLLERVYALPIPDNFAWDGSHSQRFRLNVEDYKKWRYCYVYPYVTRWRPVGGDYSDPTALFAVKYLFSGSQANGAYMFPWFGWSVLSILPTLNNVYPGNVQGLIGVAYFTTYPLRYVGLV